MKRRDLLKGGVSLGATGLLGACGGGGGGSSPGDGPRIERLAADRERYFVGESAQLIAVFSGGSGEIMPGSRPVTSGVPITVGPLAGDTELQLTVLAADGRRATRRIVLTVGYRERFRALEMGFPRGGHATAELDDGRILFIGGESGGDEAASAQVRAFDAYRETFALAGALLSGRDGPSATTLADGRVLVCGSRRLLSAPAAELFDPRRGLSSAAPGLSQLRSYHSATLLGDGRVLLAGGAGSLSSGSAELYDPARGVSVPVGPLNVPRYSHAALRLDAGRVLIYGGINPTGRPTVPELFDVASGGFSVLQAPVGEPAARLNLALCHGPTGRAWVIGGEDERSGLPLGSTVLAAREGLLSAGPALLTPRSMAGASALADGRLLVVGGSTTASFDCTAGSELLAADASAWRAGPPMNRARALASVNLLVTGKVLVAGGYDDARMVQGTAELFE